jgi:diguanylate cyclase (GGDEF)-like protein
MKILPLINVLNRLGRETLIFVQKGLNLSKFSFLLVSVMSLTGQVCNASEIQLTYSIQHIDLSKLQQGQRTGSHYHYLHDPSQKLTLAEVNQSNNWQTPQLGITNRGFNHPTSWMKFALDNTSEQTINLILEYVDPAVASIDIYQRTLGSSDDFSQANFTYAKPTSSRPIPFYRPAFPVEVPAHTSREIYLRIFAGDDFPMHSFTAMRIWNSEPFYRTTQKEMSLLIMLIVTEVLMGLATLIMFTISKDQLFLFYSLFAFAAAALFTSSSGLWPYFIATDGYQLKTVVIHISLAHITAILFVRSFLNIRQHSIFLDRVLLTMLGFAICGALLNLFGFPYYSRFIVDYTASAYVLLLPLGIYAWHKGVPHSLLFTASWLAFIIGMLFASLRLKGYIQDSFHAQWLLYIGGFIEAFLLTTIMVLHLKDMQNDKNAIEEKHTKHLIDSANQLTQKVEQQTRLLQRAKEAAEEEARIDMLTGLINRRAFTELANQCISRAKRNNPPGLYLAMLDIDYFKTVNDSYGHAVGDEILVAVSQVLKETVREIDIVSRIGGEEFAVVMEDNDLEGSLTLCERLRQEVKNLQICHNNETISVTLSIGLTGWHDENNLDELLLGADKALYQAKDSGRNQVLFLG